MGFIIPAALIVGLGFILRNGWIGWILNIITALLLGFLVMTVILTNRSEAAGYKRLEGQPGAAGAVLDSLSSGRFTGRVIQFTKNRYGSIPARRMRSGAGLHCMVSTSWQRVRLMPRIQRWTGRPRKYGVLHKGLISLSTGSLWATATGRSR